MSSQVVILEKILTLPSLPKRITFLLNKAIPLISTGQLCGEVNTSSFTRKKNVKSQEKKPLLKLTGSTSTRTLSTSADLILTLMALSIFA